MGSMSHSTVLVIGEDPEVMLEPFNEGLEVEAYPEYVNAETPSKFWYLDAAMKEGLGVEVGKTAEEITWPEFVEFVNARWKEETPYIYDQERDRIYQMSTYNPQSKWDWYSLGGRWTGHFKLKEDATGTQGNPGLLTAAAEVGWVDQARKGDIDWEGMRAQAEAEAISQHAQVRHVLEGLPPIVTFAVVRERYPDDIDEARKFYNGQLGIQALRKARLGGFLGEPVEVYHLDAEDPLGAYVAQRRREAVLTFAVLNRDGWHERGEMGWWGVVSDEKDNWPEIATRLMDEASDSDLFSVYDVHI